jgi:hypothetical protein
VAAVTMGISSCQTIPGIEEPSGWACTVIDSLTLDCVHTDDPNMEPIERSTFDSLGYICVPPRSYGDVLNHHEALHLKIEELGGSGLKSN